MVKKEKITSNLFTLTLLKAIDILDCFENDYQEIGIKEIAQMIDMPQSSVYRIMQSLEFVAFIFQNRKNKKYRLGPKALKMAGKVSYLERCRRIAVRHMEELGLACGETVSLGIVDCDKVTNIEKVESKHLLRPNFEIGGKYPAYQTGLGKVLLADMSPAVLAWVYENNGSIIGKPWEIFKAEMDGIQRQGFAYDDQEFCEGLRCVASPIRGEGGKALFSISISAPVIRVPEEIYAEFRDLAVEYARRITAEINSLEP